MADAELLEKLRAAREEVDDVRSSLRTGRTVRILGTLVALAIAIVYALLFIGLLRGIVGKDARAEFGKAIKAQWDEPATRNAMREARIAIWDEVRPVYQEALLSKLKEMDLGPVLAKEAGQVARKALPALAEGAWDKVVELNLQDQMIKEMVAFATDVGPAYYDELQAALEEQGLVSAYGEAMKEVAEAVAPAYRKALNRVAPDVLSASQLELQRLADQIVTDVSDQLRDELTKSLTAKKGEIEQQTGLTEAAVDQKLTRVVLSAESAIQELVRKRTWSMMPDLKQIQAMMAQIPEASEKDPDKLVDEIVKISLQLMKQSIQETPVEFEGRVQ